MDAVAGYKCHGDEGLTQDADDVSLPAAEGSPASRWGRGGVSSPVQTWDRGAVSKQLHVHSSGAAPRA